MSKESGQRAMEHNSFPLGFQQLDEIDTPKLYENIAC